MTNQSCGCIWILIQAPYPLALESKTQENGVGVHIPRCKAVCNTFGDWKHDRSSLAHTRRNNFQEEVSWPQLFYRSLLDVMFAELSDRWLGSDTWNQCRQCIDIYGSLYTYHIHITHISHTHITPSLHPWPRMEGDSCGNQWLPCLLHQNHIANTRNPTEK